MGRTRMTTICGMIKPECLRLLNRSLKEDIGKGDITSTTLVSESLRTHGSFIAREQGVVAGIPLLRPLFKMIDDRCSVRSLKRDGECVVTGEVLAEISGPARAILAGERLALNFLQHLSGIATLTARYVEIVNGTCSQILDTRKTIPGLRMLEKYAVKMGGGENHRMRLDDMVLIKDNHLEILGGGREAVVNALAKSDSARKKGIRVEIEVQSVEHACLAAKTGADVVMLDNMSVQEMRKAVRQIRLQDGKKPYRTLIEASGGITLRSVAAIARAGVDRISIGALTHSAPGLDIALETSLSPASNKRTSNRGISEK